MVLTEKPHLKVFYFSSTTSYLLLDSGVERGPAKPDLFSSKAYTVEYNAHINFTSFISMTSN